jgi:nicotinate-nucleotide adenylyltransferase
MTRTIGILGGSFNPAHGGHLHITLYALKKLGLDEVWWLVSPQNPLKSGASLASYEERLRSAREMAARHPGIRVMDIEAKAGTRYTWQTMALLRRRFPAVHFVWLMGADNLAQFHRWRRWQQLLVSMPLVVFDRAPYSHTSLRSKAFIRAKKFALKNSDVAAFPPAPALMFVHLRRDALSSSFLRKKLGKTAFLSHNKVK